ncbi:MAG: hypothetical protein RLZZ490_2527 [Cyanobacteriota bacterium]|jgi:hypothetical protein
MLFDVFPVVLAFLVAGSPTPVPETNQCQRFFVTAPDGYVNVRSSPAIESDNIRGVLPTGTSVLLVGRKNNWLQLKEPLSGWLARNQIYRVTCERGNQLLIEVGLPRIQNLGLKAQKGDQKSAETLIKMSPYVDGIAEETYAQAIAKWAINNPKFFVSSLSPQPSALRQAVLTSLDFGLGIEKSPERQTVETYINSLESNNIVRRDWQGRNPIYSTPQR